MYSLEDLEGMSYHSYMGLYEGCSYFCHALYLKEFVLLRQILFLIYHFAVEYLEPYITTGCCILQRNLDFLPHAVFPYVFFDFFEN